MGLRPGVQCWCVINSVGVGDQDRYALPYGAGEWRGIRQASLRLQARRRTQSQRPGWLEMDGDTWKMIWRKMMMMKTLHVLCTFCNHVRLAVDYRSPDMLVRLTSPIM